MIGEISSFKKTHSRGDLGLYHKIVAFLISSFEFVRNSFGQRWEQSDQLSQSFYLNVGAFDKGTIEKWIQR